jgi:hypothetical protein
MTIDARSRKDGCRNVVHHDLPPFALVLRFLDRPVWMNGRRKNSRGRNHDSGSQDTSMLARV